MADHTRPRGVLAGSDRHPALRADLLLWGGFAAALAVPVLPPGLAQMAGLLVALTLACLAGLLAWTGRAAGPNAARERETTQKLLAEDATPSLLLTPEGAVTWVNTAAAQAFPRITEGLEPGLRAFLTDPAHLLRQLRARLESREVACEDVVSRGGHARVILRRLSGGMLLLRFEAMVARGAQGQGPAHFPLVTVSATGTVLAMNDPARHLLGRRAHRIESIFPDPMPESGRLTYVQPADGPRHAVRVFRTPLSGDRQELALLPAAAGERPDAKTSASIDTLPVPLAELGRDGRIRHANPPARKLLGLEPGETGHFSDLVSGLGRDVADWINEALNAARPLKPELLQLRRAQTESFLQVTLGPSLHADDKAPHLIALLHDATEMKTLEAQFVQSQKMQAIGQLAGGIAHDFNNLLTAISGHCDLMLLRHDPGDPDYGDLMQITQNANRAAALVGQLLAYSRKQTLRPEVVDLRDALADLTHLLNRLVGETVTLSLLHDPDLPRVRADKRQLEQVVMNLVVNARDAMPEGGEIQIETKRLVLRSAVTRSRVQVPAGEYATIRVTDQGTGIPPDTLEKVFEPFFTTKRTGEGTGLGLSTAYGIIKQSGGYIFVDSTMGQGTEFALYLPAYHPRADETAAPVPLPTAKPQTHGDGVILLVEDEAPVRAFAARALRLRGYTVIEAGSAEEALETLETDALDVDLFVTDVVMPGLDGPSWVRKARERRPSTKAILVSGYAEDLHGAGTSGLDNAIFLPKPFSLQELTDTVATQIG